MRANWKSRLMASVAVSASAVLFPAISSAQSWAGAPGDDAIARGQYLAMIGGCKHCHTADAGDYAGGVVLGTPFGELVGPNITPDPDTGIGTWTRDDFEGALRQGRQKDGGPLYPAMPYLSFTQMTDQDIDDLWAYFRNVEPVTHEVQVIQLPFPFNIRTGVNAWQVLYFDAHRFEPDAEKSDQINRGRYLAEGPVHCTSCHTPRNAIGGPIEDRAYQGALVDGWYAPNISGTQGSALEKFDQETLTAYLADEHPDGLAAFGAMYQVTESLQDAQRSDIEAIAAFILDRAEDDEPGRGPEIESIPDEVMERGAGVYEAQCQSCHAEDGMGGENAARLVDNGGVNAQSPMNVVNVLLQGIETRNQFGPMPSFVNVLSDQELSDVSNYVRRSWGNDGPESATPEMVAESRPDAEETDSIDLTTNCPAPGNYEIPAGVRTQVGDLAGQTVAEEDIAPLVEGFHAAEPDAGYSEAMAALTAEYCLALAEAEPAVGRSVFLERQLSFMNEIDDAMRAAGMTPGE
jgi:mono/diheme cytochrome c family protein